jgi:hypothetical protein
MASTSARRWTWLAVMLVVLLAAYGDNPDFITFRSGSSLWQCRVCKRVERFLKRHRPVCSGSPERPHAPEKARPVRISERLVESDGPPQFK